MNAPDIAEKKTIWLPYVAGFICILLLFLIGLAAPVFMEMYRCAEIEHLVRLRAISHIHWFWTLPLGGLIAVGLIWISRRWSRKINLWVDSIAIGLAILVFIVFCFNLFRPIFGPFETIPKTTNPTSPGDVADPAAPEK